MSSEPNDQFIEVYDRNQFIADIESEITCSVCRHYFFDAVVVNCGHSFCLSCIEEWKHFQLSRGGHDGCPVCRQSVSTQCRQIVLDNIIESFVEHWKPHLKEHRKCESEERRRLLRNMAERVGRESGLGANTPIYRVEDMFAFSA